MGEQCPVPKCECLISPVEWGKLIQSVADIKETQGQIVDLLKTQNGRVTALEHWRWYVVGIATAISIVVVEVFRRL
jgi:hypothetical protein